MPKELIKMLPVKVYSFPQISLRYASNNQEEQKIVIEFHKLITAQQYIKAAQILWEQSGQKYDYIPDNINPDQGLVIALEHRDADFAIRMLEKGATISPSFLKEINHHIFYNNIPKTYFHHELMVENRAFGIKLYAYFKLKEFEDNKFKQRADYLNHNHLNENINQEAEAEKLKIMYDKNFEEAAKDINIVKSMSNLDHIPYCIHDQIIAQMNKIGDKINSADDHPVINEDFQPDHWN